MKKNLKILIVDDDENITAYLTQIVKEHSYPFEIFIAHNGVDALSSYEKYEQDIALIDIVMPKMSGDVLLKHLLGKPSPPWLWAITGSVNKNKLKELEQELDNQILLKPFDIDQIEKILNQGIQRKS